MFASLQMRVPTFDVGRVSKSLALFALFLVGLMAAFPSFAVNNFDNSVGGPLATALQQFADMSQGLKALVGFIGFVVALISLASLRNMGPVLFFIGLAIFAAVGLGVAGAIMGADVASLSTLGAL